MKSFTRLLRHACAVFFCLSALYACSDGNDEPDNPNPIDPDKEVADPAGTVKLSMRSEAAAGFDRTWLNNLYIDNADNFYISHEYEEVPRSGIVSIGTVKGLGNVAYIPKDGYNYKVAVAPSDGYVVYMGSKFYRIFVSDYISDVSGGVIGADIKYQEPFKGADESLKLSENSTTFDAEGGTKEVLIQNSSYIPIKVESSKAWCNVSLASSTGFEFIKDKIVIKVASSFNSSDDTAEITLTTEYGKTAKITVTRKASGPVIKTLSNASVGPQRKTFYLSFNTNIDFENLTVSSEGDWFKVELSKDASGNILSGDNPIEDFGKRYYVKGEASMSDDTDRHGKITISSKDGKAKFSCNLSQVAMYVDLGLSVKWATCNLDANSPESIGGFYAWGETSPKNYYNWYYYKFGESLSKYNDLDKKTVLDPEDDAATVNLGDDYRMPTYDEVCELVRACKVTTNTDNGTLTFTGPSGKSITILKMRHRVDDIFGGGFSYLTWTSSLYNSKHSYYLGGESYGYNSDINRCYGLQIRPVRK